MLCSDPRFLLSALGNQSCFWGKEIDYSQKASLLTLCPGMVSGGGMGTAVCCISETARLGRSPKCGRPELGWPRGRCAPLSGIYIPAYLSSALLPGPCQDTNYPILRIYLRSVSLQGFSLYCQMHHGCSVQYWCFELSPCLCGSLTADASFSKILKQSL